MSNQISKPINKDAIENGEKSLPQEKLLAVITNVFQALSDHTRVKIIYALVKQEFCVRDLAIVIGISESGISHQLGFLRELQLVKTRREGNVIYYSIAYAHLTAMLKEAEYYADHIENHYPDHPYNK